MTICAKCKHRNFRGTMWYDLYCKHPQAKAGEGIDPVTGKTLTAHLRCCGEINPNGHCKLYEEE